MADAAGKNGEYALYDIVTGEAGAQVIIMICGKRCPRSKQGVFLAFCPLLDGLSGKLSKLYSSQFQTEVDHEITSPGRAPTDARSMKGYSTYYQSLRDKIWPSAQAAVRECDRMTGIACPFTVGGNSMAGTLAHLAAYELAMFPTEDQFPELFTSSFHRQQNRRSSVSVSPARSTRVISIGAPRSGNQAFVDRINTLPIPLLRVINSGDMVPGFPRLTLGYPLDQGGVVLALPNWSTKSSETPASVVQRARCQGLLHAMTGCGNLLCSRLELSITNPIFIGGMKAFHDATTQVEPNLWLLMQAASLRDLNYGPDLRPWQKTAAAKYCEDYPGTTESDLIVSGWNRDEDSGGDLLSAWLSHVQVTGTAELKKYEDT
jgi:hypothetical protein